jgi:MFS family permease
MGGSLFVIASGLLWLYPLGAILLGAGAVSTPASSHILSRFCPRRMAPVVFSIKQTGVPFGSLIGGLMIPALLGFGFYVAFLDRSVRLDAFGTALVTGLIVYTVALALQPFRGHFDSDRNPEERLSVSGVTNTLKTVLSNPKLRDIAFGAFAFGGLQSVFSGFFVLYLIDGLHFTEKDAGFLFAVASFSAVAARIFWGWIGSSLLPARVVLGLIGAFGAVAAVLTGFYGSSWSSGMILAVAILYNVTGVSWHGLLLAEIAALAPAGRVGGTTGGVLSFTSIAMMIYPAIYGGILAVTKSYSLGFFFAAIPSALAAIIFFCPPVQGSWLQLARRRLFRVRSPE